MWKDFLANYMGRVTGWVSEGLNSVESYSFLSKDTT